jgi:hypothetical protein
MRVPAVEEFDRWHQGGFRSAQAGPVPHDGPERDQPPDGTWTTERFSPLPMSMAT